MVSISPISALSNRGNAHKNNSAVNFKGVRLPDIPIRNAGDAIEQWQRLARHAYTALNTVADGAVDNEAIQKHNFSFLDKLVKTEHQATFIEAFKRHTGFPDLQKVSENIVKEFDKVTDMAQDAIKSAVKGGPSLMDEAVYDGAEIVMKGYQPTSSAHLGKALPGSDLNGAFLIFKGSDQYPVNRAIRQALMSNIFENTDSRILSFAHPDASPKILSVYEVIQGMNEMDAYGNKIVDSSIPGMQNFFASQRMQYGLYNPHAEFQNPSRYNVALAKSVDDDQRLFAKCLGVILEGVRDGVHLKREDVAAQAISNHMSGSTTAWCSNIFQTNVLDQNLGGAIPYKPKLVAREVLSDFNNWPVQKQYDAVKTVIRGMAEDAPKEGEFAPMVSNMDEITASMRLLDYSLHKGEPYLG